MVAAVAQDVLRYGTVRLLPQEQMEARRAAAAASASSPVQPLSPLASGARRRSAATAGGPVVKGNPRVRCPSSPRYHRARSRRQPVQAQPTTVCLPMQSCGTTRSHYGTIGSHGVVCQEQLIGRVSLAKSAARAVSFVRPR